MRLRCLDGRFRGERMLEACVSDDAEDDEDDADNEAFCIW